MRQYRIIKETCVDGSHFYYTQYVAYKLLWFKIWTYVSVWTYNDFDDAEIEMNTHRNAYLKEIGNKKKSKEVILITE